MRKELKRQLKNRTVEGERKKSIEKEKEVEILKGMLMDKAAQVPTGTIPVLVCVRLSNCLYASFVKLLTRGEITSIKTILERQTTKLRMTI